MLSLSQDQLQQKIICPGPVTCLTASPNGLYILAGVAESIYLWEVRGAGALTLTPCTVREGPHPSNVCNS